MNQHQQNHRLRTAEPKPPGQGLNAFYWYQIFSLDSVVVVVVKFSWHGGFQAIAMYHHRETI